LAEPRPLARLRSDSHPWLADVTGTPWLPVTHRGKVVP
jgi:hypothetical protein